MSNLKQIGRTISMYANEHDGKIPEKLEDLRPYNANLDKILVCLSAKDRSKPSYQILLGGKQWNSAETSNTVVMTEALSNHRTGRNALYGDNHGAWLSN
jgi:hypothetical protein